MVDSAVTVRYSPSEGRPLVSVKVRILSATNATVGDLFRSLSECDDSLLASLAKAGSVVLTHRGVTLEERELLQTYSVADGSTIYAFGKPAPLPQKPQQDVNLVLRELVTVFHSMFAHPAFHSELEAVVNDPLVIEAALRAAFPDCSPTERDVFAEPIFRNLHLYYVILALRNSANVLRTLAAKRSWLLRGYLVIGNALRERISKRGREEGPVGGAPFGFGAVDYEEAAEQQQQQQQQRNAAGQRPGDAGARIRRHPQFFRPYGAENTTAAGGANQRAEEGAGRPQTGGGLISSELFAAALSRAQAIGGLATASPTVTASPAPAPAPAAAAVPASSNTPQARGPAPARISADLFASSLQQAQQATGVNSPSQQQSQSTTSSAQTNRNPAAAQPRPAAAAAANVVTERELYAGQISMLTDMGVSEEAAIEALRACDGDLDAVLQFLFGGADTN